MSDNNYSHEIRFSPLLAGDTNLHKSLLLGEFFRRAVKEGIQTSPELPSAADEFVKAVIDKSADEVLFKATLFVWEVAFLKKAGFEVLPVPVLA